MYQPPNKKKVAYEREQQRKAAEVEVCYAHHTPVQILKNRPARSAS